MTAPAGFAASIYRSTADQLTDPMRAFLAEQPFGCLATRNPDGSIHLVPTWYLFADGRFLIATAARSRKARNVAARSTATFTVDDRQTASWVSATGAAELVGGRESAELNDRLRRKYMTAAGLDALGPLLAQTEDVTIAITPRRWTAWDYESTMLAALRDAGVSMDGAASWYLP